MANPVDVTGTVWLRMISENSKWTKWLKNFNGKLTISIGWEFEVQIIFQYCLGKDFIFRIQTISCLIRNVIIEPILGDFNGHSGSLSLNSWSIFDQNFTSCITLLLKLGVFAPAPESLKENGYNIETRAKGSARTTSKLTVESSLQLRTTKLSAYAELMKSEFNNISEILPIFIIFSICCYD